MINRSSFKKGVIFSLAGHLAFFSLFSLSFGVKLKPLNYSQVNFFGDILQKYDLQPLNNFTRSSQIRRAIASPPHLKSIDTSNTAPEELSGFTASAVKPLLLPRLEEKVHFEDKAVVLPPGLIKNRELVVTLHPALPYYFPLYFNDRQVAYVELEYNIFPFEKTKEVIVKRKISSGNLEVDLLTMRYLSHFLYIQKDRLPEGSWKRVKIELSPR